MLRVENLSKEYKSGVFIKSITKAVDNVTFSLNDGETLGIAGESGCGKTTLAMMICKLISPSAGKIYIDGKDMTGIHGQELKKYHKDVQIIFQNPETAFDPQMKIKKCLLEGVRNFGNIPKNSKPERDLLRHLIDMVGLQEEHLNRYCWELSGGQVQRAVIARMLALEPKVIIADEPTSMLDVSVQAQILNLLKTLQKKLGFSMIFVAHDLDVIRAVSDQVIIMNHGEIIEAGNTEKIFSSPEDDYTKALLKTFYGGI